MITAGPDGTLAEEQTAFGLPSNETAVDGLRMTHFNLFGAQDSAADIGPLVDAAASVTADWGTSGAAVEASRPDVPFDTEDPLFRFGHGLDLRT